MAYNITLNTAYNPLSYQELLDPIIRATESHKEIEKNYGDLQAEAGKMARMTNETKDPYSYSLYSNYAKDLDKAAESLMRQGLTPVSNPNFLTLKSRYNTDILPIENAYKKREALAEEQRKALAADPTLMYQRMANNMSLDEWVKNPQADYGSQYSGTLLTKQVATIASNIARDLSYYGQGKPLDAFTNTFLEQHGWTAAQVQDALFNPNSKNAHITDALVDQVMQSSGMYNWADAPTLIKAKEYAKQGLWNLIGDSKVQQYDNYGARLAAQTRASRSSSGGSSGAEGATNGQKGLSAQDLNIDTLTVGDGSYIQAQKGAYKALKDKGYINKNNALTPKGQQRMASIRKSPKVYTEEDRLLQSVMQRAGNSIYGSGVRKINSIFRTDQAALAKDQSPTGTIGTKVQRYPVAASDEKDFFDRYIQPLQNADAIRAVGSLTYGNDGKLSFKGDASALNKDNWEVFFDSKKNERKVKVINIVNSPATGQTLLELSNGKYIFAPDRLRSESARSKVSNLYQIIQSEQDVINSPTATKEQKKNAELNLLNSYNGLRSITSQSFSKVKPKDIEADGYTQYVDFQ